MKTKNRLTLSLLNLKTIIMACIIMFIGCNKEDEKTESTTSGKSYSVTVGVYILKGSSYEDQNKDFVFDTQEGCQSWSRTAQEDKHSSSPHYHYNSAKNTTYDISTQTIKWTEYGPDLDQVSIDTTCEKGSNGIAKTANNADYSADKNFYLKIKSVVEKH
ncbi:MAG: hypothetical protein HRT66_13875 [Flavobacteriaceae bacterium]|nr:hypothetical protein [Flavobacteriaceae bacterium]